MPYLLKEKSLGSLRTKSCLIARNAVIMLGVIFVKSFFLPPLKINLTVRNFVKSQFSRFFLEIFLIVNGLVNLPDDFVVDLLDVA